MGKPDGLIAQINRATFPVPASSAESAEERLDRQNPVVERVAIIRNAKNEGIDMIDRERGTGQVDLPTEGSGSGGTGGCPSLPRTTSWSVGDGPDRAEQPRHRSTPDLHEQLVLPGCLVS